MLAPVPSEAALRETYKELIGDVHREIKGLSASMGVITAKTDIGELNKLKVAASGHKNYLPLNLAEDFKIDKTAKNEDLENEINRELERIKGDCITALDADFDIYESSEDEDKRLEPIILTVKVTIGQLLGVQMDWNEKSISLEPPLTQYKAIESDTSVSEINLVTDFNKHCAVSEEVNFVKQAETYLLHCIHWTIAYWRGLLKDKPKSVELLNALSDAEKTAGAVTEASAEYCKNTPTSYGMIFSKIKRGHEHYIFKLQRARNNLVTTLKAVSNFQ